MFGTPILPGTAFVEMALFAAQRAGLDVIEELTLEAPLALPAEGAVQLQVSVGASDGNGRRALSVHARADGAGEDAPWTRHASGLLATGGGPPPLICITGRRQSLRQPQIAPAHQG